MSKILKLVEDDLLIPLERRGLPTATEVEQARAQLRDEGSEAYKSAPPRVRRRFDELVFGVYT